MGTVSRTALARRGLLAVAVALAVLLVAGGWFARQHTNHLARTAARGQGEDLVDAVRRQIGPGSPTPDTLARVVGDDHGLAWVAVVDGSGAVIAQAGDVARDAVPLTPPHRFLGPGRDRVVSAPLVVEYAPHAAMALDQAAGQVFAMSILAALALVGLSVAFFAASTRAERATAALERDRHLARLGEMSAVLAHEIRNPVAALKGHAQLLGELTAEDPRVGPRASRIVDAATRLETLCEALLAYARTDAVAREPVDPVALVREVAGDGPAVDVVSDDAPSTWSLDPIRMRQVVANLLANARAASDRVSVTVSPGLTLTVRDHGAGFTAEALAHAFEPFHTTRAQGTGLGLAVSRRIVEAHGGTLSLGNAADGGALVTVVIPEG